MKIREQLILAFLVLAIVPLTGIVLFSYFSSKAAVKRAIEAESVALADRMREQMGGIKNELRGRFRGLRNLPLGELFSAEDEAQQREKLAELFQELGESSSFIETFTFLPSPPAAPEEKPFTPMRPADPETPPLATSPFFVMPETGEESSLYSLESHSTDESKSAVIIDFENFHEWTLEGFDPDSEVAVIASEVAMIAMNETERALKQLRLEQEKVHENERAIAEKQAIAEKRRAEIQERQARRAERFLRRQEVERRELELQSARMRRMLGDDFTFEIRDQGELIGRIQSELSVTELIGRVLGTTPRSRGEIPFVVADGELFVAQEEDRVRLEELGLQHDNATRQATAEDDRWLVVTQADPETDVLFGIARPIGDSLAQIDHTAIMNLIYGLALIGLALIGILPLSQRITRGLETVTEGAERIARGDLSAQVPVESKNEVGQLAMAFNRMAKDLAENQERLLEQKLEKRLLEADYDRKSQELEDARRFQLALLPSRLPNHESCDLAVVMRTATEVGGDYYDFHPGDDGALTLVVGDATGHGARAGTMVTAVKSLFSSSAGELTPAEFLNRANAAIRRMHLERMAMALVVGRIEGNVLTLASAGMPPVLLRRNGGRDVEEIELPATPLGSLDRSYQEHQIEVRPNDLFLFMTDGGPELPNATEDLMGYERLRQYFAEGAPDPQSIVDHLVRKAEEWSGSPTPGDDLTFVALRIKSR